MYNNGIWKRIKPLGKITQVSKGSPQNNSEMITNKHDKKIPKKQYISLEGRQKIIDDLT